MTATSTQAAQVPLPPLSISALAVGLCDLFRQADGLAMPHYVTLYATEAISLQFAPEHASIAAVTRWALRFGGVVTSDRDHKNGQQRLYVRTRFDFCGVEVDAYAFVPLPGGEDPATSD